MFWKQGFSFKKRVYADAASATPLSFSALRELKRLTPLFGNPGALHKEALLAKEELERARLSIAHSIGAHADEIIFTASGTEANNLALAHTQGHAVTVAIEHASVLGPLRQSGAKVTELPVDREGLVDPKAVEEAITDETSIVSVQLVNSEIGTIEPVREIAKVLRKQERKILFHTDASQAPLWLDIKVEKLGVDLLTLDAQKILGPKGVGALYVKRGTPLKPLIFGGGQEDGLRAGTENVPLIGAFATALSEAQRNTNACSRRVAQIRDFLWEEVQKTIPGVALNGAQGDLRVANNLNILIPGLNAEMAVVALDAEGVSASTRSACEVGEEKSYVIEALGAGAEGAKNSIRLTLLPDVTLSDARFIAKKLRTITQRYRNVV